MSSILKALKKAEQESPDPGTDKGHPFRLNVRTTLNAGMHHQRQRSLLSRKGVIFLFCVVLVISPASYVLFFPDKTIQPNPSPPKIQTQSAALPPGGKDTIPALPEKKPFQPLATAQKPDIHKAVSSSPVVKEHPASEVKNTIKKAPEQISQPISRPAPRKKEILPLENGILSIQAISWAKDPSDRIAVINNKIVGEGESVQGYHILEIGQDEVILESSDQKFRLAFTYR